MNGDKLLGCFAATLLGGFILLLFGVLVVYPIVSITGGCGVDYSVGDRSGTITKLTRKGLIWKTYEGEMNLGGLRNAGDNKMVANTWEFSIRGEPMVALVEKAMLSGNTTTLSYTQYFIGPMREGSSDYFITGVKTNGN